MDEASIMGREEQRFYPESNNRTAGKRVQRDLH